jgi:hypothetical protein
VSNLLDTQKAMIQTKHTHNHKMLIWYWSRKYQLYCHLYQSCRVETGKINYAIAVRELRRDEQLQDLEPLLSFFASFVLEAV